MNCNSNLLVLMLLGYCFSVPDFGVPWTRVDPSKEAFEYLFIGRAGEIHMTKDENLGNRKFWRSINFNENKFDGLI